jgi:SAM-dependent methyltransferase
MQESVIRQLVAHNADFYRRFAASFSASRAGPQPGYERLIPYVPSGRAAILDVGCGNGRFGRFLRECGLAIDYAGVDFSQLLLDEAATMPGRFLCRDLSLPDCLAGLEDFDFIVSLSAIQHIPGQNNRMRLLREMSEHLRSGGHIALANWQFLDNRRQRHKIRPWSEVGLQATDVEPGDYLLSWQRDGSGSRYVALLDEPVIRDMAATAGLQVVDQFRSDGREGDLNLYSILRGK